MQFTIRPIHPNDVPFLWEMLYKSLFVPEGQEPFSLDIINDPLLSKYVEGWGRKGDFGFIAIDNKGKHIGSITARYFDENNQSFGYVDENVPELGMALIEEYRGFGVGTALMASLFHEAHQKRIERISLSVDPGNTAAMKLYQRFGFEEVGMVGTSITMVASVTNYSAKVKNQDISN